jgi:hypothetical protein
MAVLNPNSGVGASLDSAFVQRTSAAQAAGIKVIGYVTTDYAARSLAAVKSEIDQYATWYGVNGYFLDQSAPTCTDAAYYQSLYDYIKQADLNLTVVLDPGINVPECYAAASDVLVTFQDTLDNYESFRPSAWQNDYPRSHFWHLVYGAPSLSDMNHAFDLAQDRAVGFLYVTDDTLPDPWDTLPGSTYWNGEVERAAP